MSPGRKIGQKFSELVGVVIVTMHLMTHDGYVKCGTRPVGFRVLQKSNRLKQTLIGKSFKYQPQIPNRNAKVWDSGHRKSTHNEVAQSSSQMVHA